MSVRKLFLDASVGEQRGVVTLEGRPERLLMQRDGDPQLTRLGARVAARVRKVEPAFASAFLELGGGLEALMSYRPDERPVQGQLLEVEVRSEPRNGKLATVRPIGPAEGQPRLIAPAPGLEDQLRAFAKDAEIISGRAAREMADQAEAEALATVHPLPGGGDIAIEPTRALVAIDVDLGERKGPDAKRVTRQANLAALSESARLLRLKGLGGIVILDLVGRGHDGNALMTTARAAFGPDNPGVSIGPVGRLGTMELSIPRRGRAVAEILNGPDGRPTDLTLALRLVRALQAEGESQTGARLSASCAPDIAKLAQPLLSQLADRMGARFSLAPDPAWPRERIEIRAQ